MSPELVSALIGVGLRVLDFLETRSGEGLSDEDLALREQLRKALVDQALAEASPSEPVGGDPD